MRELSLNVLDIAHNSIRAGAKKITITVETDTAADSMNIIISDDGCGMDKELLNRVIDPFATTRTTRSVGMGIPLFKAAAESAGGGLTIKSAPGEGTTVTAKFVLGHIDRMPLGDMADTVTMLIMAAPDINYIYKYRFDGREYIFDTAEVATILDGVPIDSPEIIEYLKGYIKQETETTDGGISI